MRKSVDDQRIGKILLLGDPGHREVLFDQKADQVGFVAPESVLTAEAPRIDAAKFAMVAAAALGDVMEQRGKQQQPGLVEIGDQLAAMRVFVGKVAGLETAQIAQHHQDVLIHRVNVEQVVLHLPHDAPERRQVGTQHRPLIHEAHGVQGSVLMAEDGQEALAIGRRIAPFGIHELCAVPDGAQQAWCHGLDFAVPLPGHEGLQDLAGIAAEQGLINDVQPFGANVKFALERLRHTAVFRKQPFFNGGQDQAVDLGDDLGRLVVGLHEDFARSPLGGGTHVKGRCQRVLQIEHQAVFPPPGNNVQTCTHPLEVAFSAFDAFAFVGGQQTAAHHVVPVLSHAGRTRHPEQDVKVAQSSRAFLAVGLQRVGGVLEFRMALLLFEDFRAIEVARVHDAAYFLTELLITAHGSADAARFEHGRHDRRIGDGLFGALRRRAHRMADGQAQVPEYLDEMRQLAILGP